MIKTALVLFLGIIMIGLTYSMSSSYALPEDLPDVAKAPFKVQVIKTDKFVAFARPLITTVDNPENHLTTNGVYDGVGMLILQRSDFSGSIGCSGSLLPTGQHVLTAAHCVTDGSGKLVLTSGDVYFDAYPKIPVVVSDTRVHLSYDGAFLKGNDIAILKLESPANSEITRYDYDKNGNSVDNVIEKVGYGVSGFFSSGYDSDKYPFGTKRNDLNKYDAFADVMYQALGMEEETDYVPEAVYQYDSDDGSKKHDAFGFFFGISDRGLSDNNEVLSAPGDSGGPTLIDIDNDGDLDVVGVTSYGITLMFLDRSTSDCTKEKGEVKLDSSCGEFAGDTRVSSYSSFIDGVLSGSTESNNPPPPPNDTPVVTILSPAPDSTFDSGTAIDFTGTVTDTEDGSTLTKNLAWSSNIDGSIGSGGSISKILTEGTHTITASVTDTGGKTGSASISIAVGDAPTTATDVIVDSIKYATEGGKNGEKHLLITIALLDDNNPPNPVSGASVSIDLYLVGDGLVGSGSGTTGSSGTITFTLKNADSGFYDTVVTDVTAIGLTWDGTFPTNEFHKQTQSPNSSKPQK